MAEKIPLRNRGFQSYIVAQFLGAFNDNAYKFTIQLLVIGGITASSGQGRYLGIAAALFTAPFILFSTYAGFLADRFSKRRVILILKVLEIVIMILGGWAFYLGDIPIIFLILFLMGTQSAFFSPAKYGILPEMLHDRDLSKGNGILEMTTFIAIILGTVVGGFVFESFENNFAQGSLIYIGVAIAGTVAAFWIPRVPPSPSQRNFEINPLATLYRTFKEVLPQRTLAYTILGIAYFFFLAAALQLILILYGKNMLGLSPRDNGLFQTMLAIGIGLGSLLAGRWSGGKVELGLVPLGAILMSIFSIDLSFAGAQPFRAFFDVLMLGLAGGLYIVPLNTLLQQQAPDDKKGEYIAFSNVLSFVGIFLASFVVWGLLDMVRLDPAQCLFVMGGITIFGTIYILSLLPDFFVRFALWLLTHTFYRISVAGQKNVPLSGPALLVGNHVSWVDAFIIGATLQRFVRFLMYRKYYEYPPLNGLMSRMRMIPISGDDSPREMVKSIRLAQEELKKGELVMIFAEGAISRTGNMLQFQKGLTKILKGLDVPVIPVHLDGLWGSIFSYQGGKFLWKWPRQIPYSVTVSYGPPLPSTSSAYEVRCAVQHLGTEAFEQRKKRQKPLPVELLRVAKRRYLRRIASDSEGKSFSYGGLLARTMVLKKALASRLGEKLNASENVGVLLPAGLPALVANIAVLLLGKVPVNLNFTASEEAFDSAVEQASIKVILTAKPFLEKINAPERESHLLLESLGLQEQKLLFLKFWFAGLIVPAWILESFWIDGDRKDVDRVATIMFSSGSTGTPKGIRLSHHNILSNVAGLYQVFDVRSDDCMVGSLPFFHSFGFTGTLWFPLLSGMPVVYHFNPLDGKIIGEMVQRHAATIFLSTPSFLLGYMRRVKPEQFSTLRIVVVGAEKLRDRTRQAFRERFGIEPLEGYGATECAPVVSINVPDVRRPGVYQAGGKPGTIGHPLPGISVKVLDPDSGEVLKPGENGILYVKGPNVMLGYLNDPEKTAEVIQDGWYMTGDIANVDEDGFIEITDRLSRFSKIGGEMVPHIKIEEAIGEIVGGDQQVAAVAGVPDERKGEKLIVLYKSGSLDPENIVKKLPGQNLPNLWIPRKENFFEVEEIPLLGSGKINLSAIKETAFKLSSAE